jgi:hypothetical protein
MFNLPIPPFNTGNRLHLALAAAGARAERLAASVQLPEGVKLQRARGFIRAALTEAGVSRQIDEFVGKLH